MSAFDKISSGFSGVDALLDHIRMGDNVVWLSLIHISEPTRH